MLRITVHDRAADPYVPARREPGRSVGAGSGGVLADHRNWPASPVPPLRPNRDDLHRCRGPGLPRGHAPPRGRIHRPRLPDESRRGRDHPDTRSGSRSSEVTDPSRYQPTEKGTSTWEAVFTMNSDPAIGERSTLAGVVPVETRDGLSPSPADGAAHPDHQDTDPAADPLSAKPSPAAGRPPHSAAKMATAGGGCRRPGGRGISLDPRGENGAEHSLHR